MSNKYYCNVCHTALESEESYMAHVDGFTQPFYCAHCPIVFTDLCVFEMHNKVDHKELKRNVPHPLVPVNQPPQHPGHGRPRYRLPDFGRLSSPRGPALSVLTRRRELLQHALRSSVGDDAAPVLSGQRQQHKGEGQQHTELLRQNETPSSSSPPSSSPPSSSLSSSTPSSNPPEGNLIDLESPEEDEYDKLQHAIAKFHKAVRYRSEASSSSGESVNNKTESQADAEPTPNMPHATRDVEDDRDPPNGMPVTALRVVRAGQAPPGIIICFECYMTFGSLVALQQHQMVLNHNYCHLCVSFFADRSFLQQHNSLVHSFPCIECTARFSSAIDLTIHQRREEHGYCTLCEAFFTDSESKQIHDEMLHIFSVCSECNETFEKAAELKEHQKAEGHCYCNQCDEAFDSEEHMAGHVALRHLHKCTAPNCTFSSPEIKTLRDHQRDHHDSDRTDETTKTEGNDEGAK